MGSEAISPYGKHPAVVEAGAVGQPVLRHRTYSRCIPVRALMCDPGGCKKAVCSA